MPLARIPAQTPKGFSCTKSKAILRRYVKTFGVNQRNLATSKKGQTSNSTTTRWRKQVNGFISSNSMAICETGLMRFEHGTLGRSGNAVSLSLAHQGLVRHSTYHLDLTDITSR
jgi:hypothetical protein